MKNMGGSFNNLIIRLWKYFLKCLVIFYKLVRNTLLFKPGIKINSIYASIDSLSWISNSWNNKKYVFPALYILTLRIYSLHGIAKNRLAKNLIV